jgi:hypothetical protein
VPGSSNQDVQHLVAGAELLLDAPGEFGPALTKRFELEVRGSPATQRLSVVIPAIKGVQQSAREQIAPRSRTIPRKLICLPLSSGQRSR